MYLLLKLKLTEFSSSYFLEIIFFLPEKKMIYLYVFQRETLDSESSFKLINTLLKKLIKGIILKPINL